VLEVTTELSVRTDVLCPVIHEQFLQLTVCGTDTVQVTPVTTCRRVTKGSRG